VTQKHLPPDTGREISGLKRRVSDLERILDRVRRTSAATVPTSTLPPFASITDTVRFSTGSATSGWAAGQAFYSTNGDELPDPTGTIIIDEPWTFVIRGPGWFELGATVLFQEAGDAGARSIGVVRRDLDPDERTVIATGARAPGVDTVLSGSRIVWCDQAAWTVWYGQDSGASMDVQTGSFWARHVSVTPQAEDAGSA
jgi:hypothetical protein